MRQRKVQSEDINFDEERRRHARGTARISLDRLQLSEQDATELDLENVERLKKIFRREGCRQHPVRNHILVLITQECLDAALGLSETSAAALLESGPHNYPKLQLPPGIRLTCLHGKHRIQAGREFLSPRDKWWVADLYLTGK